MGVRLTPDGAVHLPIRIGATDGAGLNLVPVDYVVEAFMALFENAVEGGVFHLISPEAMPLSAILDYVRRYFGIEGLEACSDDAFRTVPKNALERLLDTCLEAYEPYLRDTRRYESASAVPWLDGIRCPEFDFEMFSRCMAYAVRCGWKAERF